MYVAIQLSLFVIYLLPVKIVSTHLPEWLRYSGLVLLCLGVILGAVALLQLNTNLSPFPTPTSNGTLITTGAYRIARHPIYTALIFCGLGYAFYNQSSYKALISITLLILFYFKSKYEEKLLLKHFPEYRQYQQKTRRFL
ncbi:MULTISPECIES: methyltransferase family protein [Flavobacteriaceae]|uniref:Isoprenylcysteine carboxylmethyltransferase family protein n=1 Tax=Leeuwenhoekiella blandensis (strain CECT 7118 / CCUG 51940 / KCTC 22103 / MED217) TaxID=398720 RepID=A3XIW2_LEEBM|nr:MULTISPECIES: isoprenylcysteine carboxylmethyltransferase family protein [Flavobacteriaceae]EAQ50508.1 hypothetical protein MED217_05732 [Leeuwenhoekiella blandensis MED217]